jgi:hypothetical protein
MVRLLAAPTPVDLSPAVAAREIDEEFFALIYSDEDLLRNEFEELVGTAWSSRPPPTATPGRGAGRPPDRPTIDRPPASGRRAWLVGWVRDRGARTRSPPHVTGDSCR